MSISQLTRVLLAFLATTLAHSILAAGEPVRITIGSKSFTESVILGDMLSHLAQHAGIEVNHQQQRYQLPQQNVRGLDHDLAYRGIESGALQVTDLYVTDAEITYYKLRTIACYRSFVTPMPASETSRRLL